MVKKLPGPGKAGNVARPRDAPAPLRSARSSVERGGFEVDLMAPKILSWNAWTWNSFIIN